MKHHKECGLKYLTWASGGAEAEKAESYFLSKKANKGENLLLELLVYKSCNSVCALKLLR